jgi:hypothetical protein
MDGGVDGEGLNDDVDNGGGQCHDLQDQAIARMDALLLILSPNPFHM